MSEIKHTPGPWGYIPSTENHGPYVVGPHGGDVCDCYAMTYPLAPSVCNGGTSKPVPFCGEQADANARLIAAAPELLEALMRARVFILSEYEDEESKALDGEVVSRDARPIWNKIHAAIAKAEGRS
jgi:hypothetical protein